MSRLAVLLSSRVRAEIFRLLFGLDPIELHLREMTRRSGLTFATVRQDLGKLARIDVVLARRDGNRLYYRANRDHPLYPDLRALVLKTAGLADVLNRALGTEGIRVAFVFGSWAAGGDRSGSDVDVMIIGDVGLREAVRRLSGAGERLGREVNPHALAPGEFARRRSTGEHFVKSVLAGPRIFLIGSERDLEELGR